MKIETTRGPNPLGDLFGAPPSVEAEAEYQDLLFVEELLELMRERGMTRTELASRMGVRPSRVTSMLAGTNNFTTTTMVRAARAVGARLHRKLVPEEKKIRWQCWDEGTVHPSFRADAHPTVRPAVTFDLGTRKRKNAA